VPARSHRLREEVPAEPSSARPGRAGGRAAVDPFLELQASAGNAAVTGLIQGQLRAGLTVQGLWDTDDDDATDGDAGAPAAGQAPDGGAGPENESAAAGDAPGDGGTPASGAAPGQEEGLAPSFAAVETEVAGALDAGTVTEALAPLATPDGQVGDFEPPSGVTAQALRVQRDNTPAEPAPTREASAGDLIKAFKPFLEPALKFLEENVLDALRKLKAGDKIVTVVVAVPILVGPLTQPGPRKLALDQLDGTDITFGVIPNLQLKPQISDGQLKGGTLTYDLAPALRKAGIPF
jgi:hypothetical protein